MTNDRFFPILMDVLLIILFLSLGSMVMNLSGIEQIQHMAMLFVLMLFSVLSLLGAYKKMASSWTVLMFIVLITIVELFWVYFVYRVNFIFFGLVMIIALVTFAVTIVKVISVKDEEDNDLESLPELPAMESSSSDDMEVAVEEVLPSHSVVYKSNEPGKFVASKTGTTYHAPKCEWAKRIKKANRVWFSTDKEAKKKGYKKHDCLK